MSCIELKSGQSRGAKAWVNLPGKTLLGNSQDLQNFCTAGCYETESHALPLRWSQMSLRLLLVIVAVASSSEVDVSALLAESEGFRIEQVSWDKVEFERL